MYGRHGIRRNHERTTKPRKPSTNGTSIPVVRPEPAVASRSAVIELGIRLSALERQYEELLQLVTHKLEDNNGKSTLPAVPLLANPSTTNGVSLSPLSTTLAGVVIPSTEPVVKI